MIILIPVLIFLLAIFSAWPETMLYAVAFCLPIIDWNFSFQGFTLPLADLVALTALIAFSGRLLFQRLFKNAILVKINWPLLKPWLAFLAIATLAAILSANPLASLWYVVRWLILLYFAYIFLPYNLLTDGKRLKKTIIALAISSLVVLVSGYLSLYGQDWRDSFFRIKSLSFFGIYPFGENHNLTAEFLSVGAFMLLAWREFSKDPRARRWCEVGFIFSALAIVLTFSRAGWITLFLQLAIYAWYKLKGRQRLTGAFIAVGLLLIMSPFLWKMFELQQDNISSTENRLLLAEISWQAFREKPYLGYGPGEFINLVDKNLRFRAKYGAPLDSHGMFQKILAETGLFGLAAWIFILIILLIKAGRALRLYYRDYPWILPLILAAGGGLFFQIFNTSYYKGKVWLPVALSLAAIRLLDAKIEKAKQNSEIAK